VAGFFVYGTAALAELTRPPFDMPVADSEVVFGYLTEYTGLRFAFFLLTEYAGIVAQSAIASTLFLGGYKGVILPDGPWFLAVKVLALSFLVIWARSTYPRLREDQLQVLAWVRLVPVSLLLIFVVGLLKVV
jgi:NADH-quinone oxidoreductase subunit H